MSSQIRNISIACVILMGLGGLFQNATAATEEEMRAAMEGFVDALNAHDPESYLQVDLAVVTAPLDKITVLLGELMVMTEEANPPVKKAKHPKKGK